VKREKENVIFFDWDERERKENRVIGVFSSGHDILFSIQIGRRLSIFPSFNFYMIKA
jgi:hypothetical protein